MRRGDEVSAWSTTSRPIFRINETSLPCHILGGKYCSVFCSSILILNNFYTFNLSRFCHYSLQFLYIALSLSYLTNIFLPLLIFLISCPCEPHSYYFDGCVIWLRLLSVSFNCSLFVLITYFYF